MTSRAIPFTPTQLQHLTVAEVDRYKPYFNNDIIVEWGIQLQATKEEELAEEAKEQDLILIVRLLELMQQYKVSAEHTKELVTVMTQFKEYSFPELVDNIQQHLEKVNE